MRYRVLAPKAPRPPLEFKAGQDWLRKLFAWSEQRNLYWVRGDYLGIRYDQPTSQPVTGLNDMNKWLAFWEVKDTGSLKDQPRYQSARLNARDLSRPEEFRVEDFRLQPGSPGKTAGEGGRDLGATVELVGPGPAYDYWRRTPEYQAWLKTTGQRQ